MSLSTIYRIGLYPPGIGFFCRINFSWISDTPATYLFNDVSAVVWKLIQHMYLTNNDISICAVNILQVIIFSFVLYEYFISVFKKGEYSLFLMM